MTLVADTLAYEKEPLIHALSLEESPTIEAAFLDEGISQNEAWIKPTEDFVALAAFLEDCPDASPSITSLRELRMVQAFLKDLHRPPLTAWSGEEERAYAEPDQKTQSIFDRCNQAITDYLWEDEKNQYAKDHPTSGNNTVSRSYAHDEETEPIWQDYANCLGVDPELFFPARGESTKEAKEVCRGCVVREECLEQALMNTEKFGIWGGMSERERRGLRRQRRLAQTVIQA